MSAETNKATFHTVVEALNKGDIDGMLAQCTPDYQWHGPGGQEKEGLDAMREMLEGYLGAFPGLEMRVHELLADGDKTISRFTITGKHTGPLGPIAASGNAINLGGIAIVRYEGGKMAEEWENFDELAMMQQVGAIPAMA